MASKKRKRKQKGLQLPHHRSADPVERIIQRGRQSGLQAKFVRDPQGQVRMSDVLADFIDPYVEAADSTAGYRTLLLLSITAWNAALLPEEKRAMLVDKVLASQPQLLRQDARAFIAKMIERKQKHFGAYDRVIVDFELEEQGDNYHITVASIIHEKDT